MVVPPAQQSSHGKLSYVWFLAFRGAKARLLQGRFPAQDTTDCTGCNGRSVPLQNNLLPTSQFGGRPLFLSQKIPPPQIAARRQIYHCHQLKNKGQGCVEVPKETREGQLPERQQYFWQLIAPLIPKANFRPDKPPPPSLQSGL